MKTRTAEREFRSWVRLARWTLWSVTREIFRSALLPCETRPGQWYAKLWCPRLNVGVYRLLYDAECFTCRSTKGMREFVVAGMVSKMLEQVREAERQG